MNYEASIVIATHNRRDELVKAIGSALKQDARLEIIVLDDGSTDGTAEMVKTRFPEVRLHRSEVASGYITQRNAGIRLASAPIVVSIDDDAWFSSRCTIKSTLKEFDQAYIGAVAIPFVNVRQDATVIHQRAPTDQGVWVCSSFVGTAHALRRDVFLGLGGYREALFHQGEEGDYCLRMLEAGYITRLGCGHPISHSESPRRDFRRLDIFGRRNNILFAWHHIPRSRLLPYLVATTWNGVLHGVRVARPLPMIAGLLRGYAAIWKERDQRRPVSSAVYHVYRDLVRRRAVKIEEVEARLSLRHDPVT